MKGRRLPTRADPWAGTAGEMRSILAALFERHHASAADALDAAERVVVTLANLFGGHPVYLPAMRHFSNAERDRAIFGEATGRNTAELARKHGLSMRHVQRIVEEQARAHRSRTRGDKHAPRQTPDDVQ